MSTGRGNDSLYLVDAHSLIFQVFHALPEMSSPSGLPTNALFGFAKDMLFLRNDKKPDYLVVAFDMSGPTFRDAIDPEYKAHRAPMPDDLQLQIPLIQQLLEAMRIPIVGIQGYEADDVIATLAKAGGDRGLDVFICSSDKDCRQLINDRVRMYSLRKRQVFDAEALQKDWGIKPAQVVDLQTLVGDSVDNVKGVPGIGLKTASKLLQDYGTIDNILAHVEEIPGAKRQENLRAAGPIIERARQLVRLATDVPINIDWDAWRVGDWDAPRLLALFREWGFHRFADQVRESSRSNTPSISGGRNAPVSRERSRRADPDATRSAGLARQEPRPPRSYHAEIQGSLFGEDLETLRNGQAEEGATAEVARAKWDATYHLVDTPERFAEFFAELTRQDRIALDLETTSLEPRRAALVGLAFCWKPGEAWYLAVRAPEGDQSLDAAAVLEQLRPVLEKTHPEKVNQNIKYDMQVLRQHGIELAGVVGDSMVADYLLHAGERSHGMDTLADKHLNHVVIPITDLIGKGKNQLRMDQVSPARIAEYAGEDADVAWRLCALLEPMLEVAGVKKLYDDLEVPLIEVLAELEFNGIRLDVGLLRRMGEEMTGQLAALEQDIHRLAGREFNIASLKQLRQVMFEELKLPQRRKTNLTGEASTDQETLDWLASAGHELPRKLVEHRRIAKLKGTYIDALPLLVNPETGRIHASFNQTVAATGRLSSSDPNLQNIPVRSEQGEQIRQAFLPEPGWQLIAADYSQIELRLLAHFSEDEEMRRAFAEDMDIHARVAAQVFGVSEDAVTPEMRRAAKTVNFGVIYGISAFGLAQRLEIDKDEAGRFIDAYFARYPKVLAYQDGLLNKCRMQGYVSTILGRRRSINGIRRNTSHKGRNQPEREAINMEIQGSAADLIKVAMLNCYRRLKRENRKSRMLLQIHDELVFETPPEELPAVAALVEKEMANALADRLQVPIKVDVSVGPNWLDVRDYQGNKVAV
ncbi:MAG: DNA polymerase I [Planctomycetes bacterium]|nr:DNA polymerase I [Planctomycetota bacterium]